MSDDIHIDGQNEEMDFEREDLGAKPILIFLLSMIIGCVLVALVLKGLYSYLDGYENRRQPVQNPLVQQTTADTRTVEKGDIKRFPQPRLETDETTEINAFRLQEEQTLHSYGWVDQQAGMARIPIDRAMALVAQRGLPTRPQAGVVPPSDVKAGKRSGATLRYERPARKGEVMGRKDGRTERTGREEREGHDFSRAKTGHSSGGFSR